MKLVQLGPYPPPHGGVQSNLVAIRRYLEQRGLTSGVINLTRHRAQEKDEVYYPRTPLQVLQLLFRGRYDVIHLHVGGDLTLRLILLGLVCTLVPGARTVITFHSGGYPGSRKGKRTHSLSLAALMFRRADRLIAVNLEIVDFFRRLQVPETHISLIAPHALPSLDARHESLPRELEQFYHDHTPVLATVGLLEPEYDLPLQLEAMAALRERFPRAGLVIIGSGSTEIALRQRIKKMGLDDRVLLCGDVPHTATLRAISRARILLRTTHYDGDSVAVREALHLGIPVIATDNGMRPPGVVLMPARDLQALLNAVVKVTEAGTVASAGRTADDSNIAAVFDLYQRLVGAQGE